MNAPVRVAHGYGNNRRSLRLAFAAPVDVIETDIWFRGGDIYVRHESRLGVLPLLVDKRMPGHFSPPMSLPLRGGYYIRLDVNPLRLAGVLDMVQGQRRVMLDVKGEYREGQISAFASALIGQIRERSAERWVAVCGQFWPLLQRLRELAPDLEVRYSIEKPGQWERFVAMVADGDNVRKICIEHRFLNDEMARFLQTHGAEAYCWTVDDSVEALRLMAIGVDGIISNDLELLGRLTN